MLPMYDKECRVRVQRRDTCGTWWQLCGYRSTFANARTASNYSTGTNSGSNRCIGISGYAVLPASWIGEHPGWISAHSTIVVTPREQPSPSLQGPPNLNISDPDPEIELRLVDHLTTQFIRDITQIADSQSAARPEVSLGGNQEPWSVETNTSFMVVPKRAVADDLLDCYEKHVYPLFPVLHMPTFRENYERLWKPPRLARIQSLAEEATFCATLNIVLALGCLNNSKI